MIENSPINPLSSSQKPEASQPVDPRGRRPVTETAASRDQDKAELSQRALLLSKARTALTDTPVNENPRVAELRKQIEDGSYTVPVEQLVQAMIKRLDLKG